MERQRNVLGAVGSGVAEIGHILPGHDPCPKTGLHFSGIMPAAFYWQGKMPAVSLRARRAKQSSSCPAAPGLLRRTSLRSALLAMTDAGGGQAL